MTKSLKVSLKSYFTFHLIIHFYPYNTSFSFHYLCQQENSGVNQKMPFFYLSYPNTSNLIGKKFLLKSLVVTCRAVYNVTRTSSLLPSKMVLGLHLRTKFFFPVSSPFQMRISPKYPPNSPAASNALSKSA